MVKIWYLIERILFAKQVLLVSHKKSNLIAWSEILKNIIFPFKYTGPIIPYMARIDLEMLTSGISLLYKFFSSN